MDSYEYKYFKYKNKYIALRDSMDKLNGGGDDNVVFENIYGTPDERLIKYVLTAEQAKSFYHYVSQPNTLVIGNRNIAQFVKEEMERAGITMANLGTRKFVVGTFLYEIFALIDRKNGRPFIDYSQPGRMANPPKFD